jgi:hypothetical protein
MNRTILIPIIFLIAVPSALGRFTDPMANSGERAKDLPLQRMGHQNFVPTDRPYVAPDRPATSSLADKPKKDGPRAKTNERKDAETNNNPVARAPSLPWERGGVEIPALRIPEKRKLAPKEELVQLNANNRDEVLAFLAKARKMPAPERNYHQGEGASIQRKYLDALQPYAHQAIHSVLELSLQDLSAIQQPPAAIHYQNMVARLDALFDGFYSKPQTAVSALWSLSEQNSNNKKLQSRDALFAGIVSQDAGWEMAAGNLFVRAAQKGIDQEDRYLQVLWTHLEQFSDPLMVNRVVAEVNPNRILASSPMGDRANFSLALRLSNERELAQKIIQRISSSDQRVRFEMLNLPSLTESFDANQRVELLRGLQSQVSEGSSIYNEIRLAMARDLLRAGSTGESLDVYRSITKNGRNRLEVMGEQAYVEFRVGYHGQSLGKAVGLQSPYFRHGYSPEVHVVEILNRKALCDFGGAEVGAKRFRSTYGIEAEGLRALSAATNPLETYENLIARHASTTPYKFERYLLSNPVISDRQKLLNRGVADFSKLERTGLKSYSVRPAAWDDFLLTMKVQWSAFAYKLKEEIGAAAIRESKALLGKLEEALVQTELLSLDIASQAARNFHLQSALNFPVRRLAAEERTKDFFHWPFEDEVWEDELDFLTMKNPSRCARSMVGQ